MFKLLLTSRRSAVSSSCRRTISSDSVNNDEVSKFAAIGNAWWDHTSIQGVGPLHKMNPARIQFIRDNVAACHDTRKDASVMEKLQGLTMLDVGCGGGILSEGLARLGAHVTGIDPSSESIAVATRHSKKDSATSTITYRRTTIEELAERGEMFDVVCSLEVIEHVDSPHAFVQKCIACIKPGGSLLLSTINRTSKAYALAILGAEHMLNVIPVGTHDWNKFITPKELEVLVSTPLLSSTSTASTITKSNSNDGDSSSSDANYKMLVTKVQGLVPCADLLRGQPFGWTLSDSDTDVNYILHAVKIRDTSNVGSSRKV